MGIDRREIGLAGGNRLDARRVRAGEADRPRDSTLFGKPVQQRAEAGPRRRSVRGEARRTRSGQPPDEVTEVVPVLDVQIREHRPRDRLQHRAFVREQVRAAALGEQERGG